MRLLTFEIQEPLPGRVLPLMADETSAEEAARRYRAIVITTLRQLRGLADARLRLQVTPDDGRDAVRFWILPRLADRWLTRDDAFHTDGFEIDFGGCEENFRILATGEILCPDLGARWVHAGLLGLGTSAGEIIGPTSGGGEYLRARPAAPAPFPVKTLPPLPAIRTDADWHRALDSMLGPALTRAWEEEA